MINGKGSVTVLMTREMCNDGLGDQGVTSFRQEHSFA